MKKKSTVLLIIFCVFLVIINLYSIITNVFSDRSNNEQHMGVGKNPDILGRPWEADLSIQIDNIYLTIYNDNENHGIKKGEEYKISLEAFQKAHNVDFSFLNTKNIMCNLDNSYIRVYYDGDYLLRAIDIDCKKY